MPKEYIEREALKEDLKESYDRLREIYYGLTYDEDKQICAGQLTTFTDAILRVKEAPAADVVEVVRCRECKYWGDEAGKLPRSDGVLFARCKVHNYLLDGRHTGWCPTENDFCSYGERKEGAD